MQQTPKTLTKELADEAQESYNLKFLGVDYDYATTAEIDPDSALYIQQYTLYDEAQLLAENYSNLLQHQVESYKRHINPLSFFLSFVLFALLGYCSRNKSINKIFGIIALILVSAFLLQSIERYVNATMREIVREARQYGE